MFMVSRRRRVILVLIPAIASLLFALMSFFIVRSDPPNVSTWRGMGLATLVVGLALLVAAARVPEHTRKRRRLEAIPPVEAELASWLVERHYQGNTTVPYYLVVVSSSEDLYLSRDVSGAILEQLVTANEESRLVPLIEGGFIKSLTKKTTTVPLHQVAAVRSDPDLLTVSLVGGEQRYHLTDEVDHEQVAAYLASIALVGTEPVRTVERRDEGTIRSEMVDHITVSYTRPGRRID